MPYITEYAWTKGVCCPKCGKDKVVFKEFKAADSNYEDRKFKCHSCGEIWWKGKEE